MQTGSLATALKREHQQIDAGIAAFTAAPWDRQPLTRAISALRRHIYLEEEFLFPLLCQAEPALAAPVLVMLREHAQIWGILGALEHQPGNATATGPAALCKRLTSHLLHHNLKEEKVLYPRASDVLTPAAARHLTALSGTAKPPGGWVCTKARTAASDADR